MPAYERKVVLNKVPVPDTVGTFEEFVAVYELLTSQRMIVKSLDPPSPDTIAVYCDDLLRMSHSTPATFRAPDSLNGSHGEATNTDDLAPVFYESLVAAVWLFLLAVLMQRLPERHRTWIIRVWNREDHLEAEVHQGDDQREPQWFNNRRRSPSQINGANGEATGSDDLDRPANAGRRLNQLRRRVARNHQHQRPVPNGRADSDDDEERAPGVPRPQRQQPVVEEAVEDNPRELIYILSLGQIFVNGVLTLPGNLPTVDGGQLVANVVQSGDGHLIVQVGKGQPHVAADILSRQHIPSYTTFDASFPSRDYMVFDPLLRQLQKQLAGKQSPNTPMACSAIGQKLYPRLSVEMQHATIQYFIHLNEYSNAAVLRGNNLIRRMLGAPASPETLMCNQLMELSLVQGENPVTPREFNRIPAETCDMVVDYPLRTDFVVVRAMGTTWDALRNESPTLEDNGYFWFDTGALAPKWNRTHFFSFRGHDQARFVQYDNNGHNASCGLKRLVGARDDQAALQAAQQSLIPRLADVLGEGCCAQTQVQKNFFSLLRTMHTTEFGVTSRHGCEIPNHLMLGRIPVACQPMGPDLFDLAQDRIARLHAVMIRRTCRSTMQSVVDEMSNSVRETVSAVSTYLYDNTFKGLYEFFSPDQQRHLNAAIPHDKQQLRQQYVNGVLTHLDDDIMVRRLDAQVKNETAKFGKASRLYVSYGAGCMFANDLPDFLKSCIKGWYDLGIEEGMQGYLCVVTKTKTIELTEAFETLFRLRSAPNTYLALEMSDDMHEMANCGGTIYAANTDVVSNDSANGAYVFGVYGTCLANFNPRRAAGIVEQCMQPVTLRNPTNRDEVVTVAFAGPLQGSGTVATGGLNGVNSAGTCVGTFVYLAHSDRTEEAFKASIAAGAAACGHTKTVEMCDSLGFYCPEKTQFLKRSPLPCEREGVERMFMVQNLGCVLRNFGLVDGDLTAAMVGVTPMVFATGMSPDEKADRFFSSVVAGYKNNPTCPVLKALRTRFSLTATDLPVSYKNVEDDADLSSWTVSTAALLARYDMHSHELDELVDLISRTRVGYSYTCTALSKIYAVDYGMA